MKQSLILKCTPVAPSNCKYSTGNVFKMLENDGYEISWYLVKSDSLIDSKGMVQFIPQGKKTLLKYKSLIHPDSKLASMFFSKARSGMSKNGSGHRDLHRGNKKEKSGKDSKVN